MLTRGYAVIPSPAQSVPDDERVGKNEEVCEDSKDPSKEVEFTLSVV